MVIKFKNRVYATHKCSKCGCVLGTPFAYKTTYANCVGLEEDEEGYNWKQFCDSCWKDLSCLDADVIYEMF